MKRILPTIVIAQFFCTSLWFAGNAVLPDIIKSLQLKQDFLVHLTSAVQFGFISGTLTFSIFTISDRYSPSKVFLFSSLVAALFNLGITLPAVNSSSLLTFRFFTGFFLAGIYPVGMKIASDYYQKGLGRSLGFLVGALVLGTAFPHLIKSIGSNLPWRYVAFTTSALSVLGGLMIFVFVPDGPFRKPGQELNLKALLSGFKVSDFRAAAFGYFGHMWELYAFWAFVPVMLGTYKADNLEADFNLPFISFLVIASGGIACAASGLLSEKFGAKRIAMISLALSGICCLISPLVLSTSSIMLLLGFLFFWGLVVVADSPLFSTLVAQNAPQDTRGTSLTIVNCIGFSITIISIQLLGHLSSHMQFPYVILAVGPIIGLIALLRKS